MFYTSNLATIHVKKKWMYITIFNSTINNKLQEHTNQIRIKTQEIKQAQLKFTWFDQNRSTSTGKGIKLSYLSTTPEFSTDYNPSSHSHQLPFMQE